MTTKLDETKDKATLDAWKVEARTVTIDALVPFVRRLTEEYEHDYGTICHAIHAAMLATLSAIDKSPQGGITGFQASCIGWMQIHSLFCVNDDAPLRLTNYDDLLFPQYENRFRTISKETWGSVQEKARKFLVERSNSTARDVLAHWQSIATGIVPFGLRVGDDS